MARPSVRVKLGGVDAPPAVAEGCGLDASTPGDIGGEEVDTVSVEVAAGTVVVLDRALC